MAGIQKNNANITFMTKKNMFLMLSNSDNSLELHLILNADGYA